MQFSLRNHASAFHQLEKHNGTAQDEITVADKLNIGRVHIDYEFRFDRRKLKGNLITYQIPDIDCQEVCK